MMDNSSHVDWDAKRVAQEKLSEPNAIAVFALVALLFAAVVIFGMLAFDSIARLLS